MKADPAYKEAMRLAEKAGFVVHESDDPNSPPSFHGQAHEDAFIKLIALARKPRRSSTRGENK